MKMRILAKRAGKDKPLLYCGMIGRYWFIERKPTILDVQLPTEKAEQRLNQLKASKEVLVLHPKRSNPEDFHTEYVPVTELTFYSESVPA